LPASMEELYHNPEARCANFKFKCIESCVCLAVLLVCMCAVCLACCMFLLMTQDMHQCGTSVCCD
jgi:hypothetical protein